MAAQKLFVEVQDEQGNIYYVHTSSDVVFCADGETVEEKLKNATTEKDGRMSATDKKKLDGIAEGANKYVHPTGSGNKHIPSGGSAGKILRWSADGTAVWGDDKDTTYTAFKAATSSAAGGAGLVPAPAAGNHDDYLRGDGKWGAASDMVQTFSRAASRANIASGEANKTLFGKISKWFADLGVSGIAAFAKIVNNGTTTVANTVLDGRFGKILLDRIVAAEKNITTINSALKDEFNLNSYTLTNSSYYPKGYMYRSGQAIYLRCAGNLTKEVPAEAEFFMATVGSIPEEFRPDIDLTFYPNISYAGKNIRVNIRTDGAVTFTSPEKLIAGFGINLHLSYMTGRSIF